MPVVAAALAPSAFWLLWFSRKAGRQGVRWQELGLLFVLGTLSAGLALVVETGAAMAPGASSASASGGPLQLLSGVLEPVVVEEAAKLLVVVLFVLWLRRPRGSAEGALWAIAAALGFAAVENFLFMSRGGLALVVLRGPVSTLAHALFSALWGSALGVAAASGWRSAWALLSGGFLAATMAHAVFNLIAVIAASSPNPLAISFVEAPLLLALYYACIRAWSRSAQMSSTSSMPTETLTSPSPIPTA